MAGSALEVLFVIAIIVLSEVLDPSSCPATRSTSHIVVDHWNIHENLGFIPAVGFCDAASLA
jgi:hypothetical protein